MKRVILNWFLLKLSQEVLCFSGLVTVIKTRKRRLLEGLCRRKRRDLTLKVIPSNFYSTMSGKKFKIVFTRVRMYVVAVALVIVFIVVVLFWCGFKCFHTVMGVTFLVW